MAHVVQHPLDELSRFGTGQSKPVMHDVREVRARLDKEPQSVAKSVGEAVADSR